MSWAVSASSPLRRPDTAFGPAEDFVRPKQKFNSHKVSYKVVPEALERVL
jgi:hypothetical protein